MLVGRQGFLPVKRDDKIAVTITNQTKESPWIPAGCNPLYHLKFELKVRFEEGSDHAEVCLDIGGSSRHVIFASHAQCIENVERESEPLPEVLEQLDRMYKIQQGIAASNTALPRVVVRAPGRRRPSFGVQGDLCNDQHGRARPRRGALDAVLCFWSGLRRQRCAAACCVTNPNLEDDEAEFRVSRSA